MNFYVVGYLPRETDPSAPDYRTGRIVSGHAERATAERMLAGIAATAGRGTWTRFGCLFRVEALGELRGPLRRKREGAW
jgi:hypothetical protein